MPLIGIVAKTKDIQSIKKEIELNNIKIIEMTEKSIKNLKNIKFDEIILMQDIKLEKEEYKYMKEIISNVNYLIINEDIKTEILKEIQIEKPIKLITFGFNHKATITVSSIKEDKIIICVQRDIQKNNRNIIEVQEREIYVQRAKKIYNKLAVFIIEELHNS